MKISEIQKLLDDARDSIGNLSKRVVANRIEAERRRGDPEYRRNCSVAQLYSNQNNLTIREQLSLKKSKPLQTPWGLFPSSLFFNQWIQEKITVIKINAGDKRKSLPHLYYQVDSGPGSEPTEKVVHTPYGKAPKVAHPWFTLNKLHRLACEQNDPEALKNKRAAEWFKKMNYRDPEHYYETQEVKREWMLELFNEQYTNLST